MYVPMVCVYAVITTFIDDIYRDFDKNFQDQFQRSTYLKTQSTIPHIATMFKYMYQQVHLKKKIIHLACLLAYKNTNLITQVPLTPLQHCLTLVYM